MAQTMHPAGTVLRYPGMSVAPSWHEPPPGPPQLTETLRKARALTPHRLKEYNMNGAKCSTAIYDGDDCCEVPEPCSTAATLKRLRKQAKRIRKEIAAVKKQQKATAKAQAAAEEQAKQRRADREAARVALLRVASDPSKGYAAVEAARTLLDNYNL